MTAPAIQLGLDGMPSAWCAHTDQTAADRTGAYAHTCTLRYHHDGPHRHEWIVTWRDTETVAVRADVL